MFDLGGQKWLLPLEGLRIRHQSSTKIIKRLQVLWMPADQLRHPYKYIIRLLVLWMTLHELNFSNLSNSALEIYFKRTFLIQNQLRSLFGDQYSSTGIQDGSSRSL